MIIAICVFALAYRYYSAFLSARVLALDPKRTTPANRLNDGHDYHPTNKWVLFIITTALAIGTTVIMKSDKDKRYALVTFIPMLFMLATTLTAGVENIFNNYLPQGTFNGNLNAALSAAMLILVVIIVADSSVKWVDHIRKHGLVERRPDKELRTKEKEPAMELDI